MSCCCYGSTMRGGDAWLANVSSSHTYTTNTHIQTTLQPEFKSESGFEHRGSDWPSLFKGLKKDSELV